MLSSSTSPFVGGSFEAGGVRRINFWEMSRQLQMHLAPYFGTMAMTPPIALVVNSPLDWRTVPDEQR
jgi:hypothetical protein